MATLAILVLSVAWWLAERSFEPAIVVLTSIAGLLSAEAASATRHKRKRRVTPDEPGVSPVPLDKSPLTFAETPHTVGRQDVMERLHEELRSTGANRRGRLVCITGEAGMGKTTVAENFLSELSPDEAMIARGRCSERLAGAEAYLPLLEALESMLRDPRADEVSDLMNRTAPTWCAQLVPPPDSMSGNRSEMAIPQERLKREIARFFEGLTRNRPLILFLEDLHWADVATVDVLTYLADRFDSMGALVLTTYRPEDMRLSDHPFLQVRPTLEQRSLLAEIPLRFLTLEDIKSYVALEYPGHSFPAELPAAVYRRTEGSPLFVVALLRNLRDLGLIAIHDGSWKLTRPVEEVEASFPKTLASTIEQKVERLQESERELLGVAAVQGYEFDAAVIAKPLGLDTSVVEQRLRKLDQDHGLVARLDDQTFPDGTPTARYEFVHVLYQHGLLESIGPTQKAGWSRRVAEALIEHYRANTADVAARVGLLFEVAREYDRAAAYLRLAAREALRLSAPTEAVALCRKALRLLDSAAPGADQDELRLHLLTDLGSALMLTVGWGGPQVIEVYHQARELAKRTGVVSGLPRLILQGLWYRWTRRDVEEIPPLMADLHAAANQTRDPATLQYARWMDALVEFWRGHVTAARPIFDEAMSLYRPGQDNARFIYGQDSYVATSAYACWNLCLAGYPDQARSLAAGCLTAADTLNHPYTICYGLTGTTWVSIMRRDVREALERAGHNVEIAQQQEAPFAYAYAGVQRGWARAHQGQGDAGLKEMLTSLGNYERLGAVLATTFLLALLADIHLLAGRPQEGLEVINHALALEKEKEEFTFDAELHRLRGELSRLDGADTTSVEACYRTALEIAREQESRWFELRAAKSLAGLLREEGRQTEAKDVLQPTYGWFTEGFETPDLREAENLLQTLA